MTVERVRDGILGAGPVTVLTVVKGGKPPPGKGDPPAREGGGPPTVLGHCAGTFVFLDSDGQERKLTSRQLGTRADLVSLTLGDTSWLLKQFPKTREAKDEAGNVTTEVVGFQTAMAAEFLMRQAHEAGQFGPHVTMRRPGIWPGPDRAPVVHCGDVVRAYGPDGDADWRRSGFRLGDSVWPSAPRQARPGKPAPRGVGQTLQDSLRRLWDFRRAGGEMVTLGLVCIGYYGAAATWRSNGFLTGPAGCGKSMLLSVMRALAPLHHYTNDTTKAGLEQSLDGRAMPSFVDEASDRADQRGAQALMDLVLASSGAEGTKGHRGGVDGHSRTVEVVGAIVMAAVSPPDMKPQHLARFTMLELRGPAAGRDFRAEQEAVIASARKVGPALWARALDGWERWEAALAVFRRALGEAGCRAREMDQMGAILAGWWVLARDGVPDHETAYNDLGEVRDYIRDAGEVEQDDSPRRMINLLASSTVSLHRSTDREQVGVLVRTAFGEAGAISVTDDLYVSQSEAACRVLAREGIRVVLASEVADKQGRPAPRGGDGDGLLFATGGEGLRHLFKGSPFEGSRYVYELLRLESARQLPRTVRIGGYTGRAVWLSRSDWEPADPHDTS